MKPKPSSAIPAGAINSMYGKNATCLSSSPLTQLRVNDATEKPASSSFIITTLYLSFFVSSNTVLEISPNHNFLSTVFLDNHLIHLPVMKFQHLKTVPKCPTIFRKTKNYLCICNHFHYFSLPLPYNISKCLNPILGTILWQCL